MLCWIFWDGGSTEGPKSDDFSAMVCALGVKFDLSSSKDGLLRICNTEKRIAETVALLEAVISRGTLQKREALVLRGRLAFCDAFIFGRLGKIALQDIVRHAYTSPFVESISPLLVNSMRLLMDRLSNGKPRVVSCKMLETWFLFTDASFDKLEGSGLGAVLVSSEGTVNAWFELKLDITDLGPLLDGGAETVIGELETLVVAMALMIWSPQLESTQVMVYIDNEGSKYSLIKGYSVSRAIS